MVGNGCCGCLHRLLAVVERKWWKVRNWCFRRRTSHRLYLFHSIVTLFNVITSIFALVIYFVVWNSVSTVGDSCDVSAIVKEDDPDLKTSLVNHMLEAKGAVVCSGEQAPGTCSLAAMSSVIDAILANSITNLIQLLSSVSLCLAYRRFRDLPREKLQHGKITRSIKCCGCCAKTCPWIARLFVIVQIILVLTLLSLISANTCRGDLSMTHYCAKFQKECGYNKFKNCLYYSRCQTNAKAIEKGWMDDEVTALECLNSEIRSKFSGSVDIRLISDDECVRCRILNYDLKSAKNDFELVSKKDTRWRCLQDSTVCFDTIAWPDVVCSCESAKMIVDMEVAEVKAWWDAKQGQCGRRMQDASTEAPNDEDSPAETPPPDSPPNDEEGAAADADEIPKEQPCAWAPSEPKEFFFTDETSCLQAGSFAFRFSGVYVYFASLLMIIVFIIGQGVRLLTWPEPWFHYAAVGGEHIFWRCLRLVSP